MNDSVRGMYDQPGVPDVQAGVAIGPDGPPDFGTSVRQETREELRIRVRREVADEIAWALEECADDLTPPITTEWLELRDWFKGQLHEAAAKAREVGAKP